MTEYNGSLVSSVNDGLDNPPHKCILCKVAPFFGGRQNRRKWLSFQSFRAIFFVLLVTLTTGLDYCYPAGNLPVSLRIVGKIESGGQVFPDVACSFRGCSYGRGRYQVSEIVLREYNQFLGTNYQPGDLFVPEVNLGVASWYLGKRIPQMLRHFKRPVSPTLVLVSYNAGISYALKGEADWPRETRNYLRKYQQHGGSL